MTAISEVKQNTRSSAMKSFSMGMTMMLIGALLTGFNFSATAQDAEIDAGAKQLGLSLLEIPRSILVLDEMRLTSRIEAIDSLVGCYRRLPKIVLLLKSENEKVRNDTKTLLMHTEKFINLIGEFAPKHYNKEISPMVFDHINGKPLPSDTVLQKRLIIWANEDDFEALIEEIDMVIAEDKKLMEKKRSALISKIIAMDDEIEKLKKK